MLLLFLVAGIAAGAQQFVLPSVFSDGMVLQRQSDVPVWGWAAYTDSEVQITGSWVPDDTVVVRATGEGVWKTTLRTAEAGGPYTLLRAGNSVESDVLSRFGDGQGKACENMRRLGDKMYGHAARGRDRAVAGRAQFLIIIQFMTLPKTKY